MGFVCLFVAFLAEGGALLPALIKHCFSRVFDRGWNLVVGFRGFFFNLVELSKCISHSTGTTGLPVS